MDKLNAIQWNISMEASMWQTLHHKSFTVGLLTRAPHPCSSFVLLPCAPHPCSSPVLLTRAPPPCSSPVLLTRAPHPCSSPVLLPCAPHLCSSPVLLPCAPHLCSSPVLLTRAPHPCSSPVLLPCAAVTLWVMGVLAAPWADLALFLRSFTDSEEGFEFPLWICGLVLFISFCLVLLQLIVFFNWKLRQVETELSMALKRSAPSRSNFRSAGCERKKL